MNKKKILILMMSCNDSFFIKQEELAKITWAKDIIEKKYENIDFLIYRGSTNKHSIDFKEHLFNVRCEDDLQSTFKKTFYALSIIKNKFNYDYIFRCNTSTYVNVPLLNEFIQHIDDPYTIWGSELYSLSEGFCPYPLYLFARGNGFIISKELLNILINEGFPYIYLGLCDDWVIGNILNSYWMKKGENYLDHIKSYRHGWYKCIKTDSNANHSLCQYYNENCDFDFIKTFITVQIKRYHERELENDNYIELYNKGFKDKVDNNLEETVKLQFEYSKNPNIFLGSIIGYIQYNDWLKVDKSKLYDIQVNNKADDDEQKYKANKVLL